MPYCDSDSVHYRVEGNPEGPPLVLQMGFSMSLQDWYEAGYVAALAAYRLILVDPRGHGASDKPHDRAAYAKRVMAADVVAVLDHLGIERAHFLGYSLGAGIGFACAVHASDRFRSLIFGGGNPAGGDPSGPDTFREWLQQGLEAYAAGLTAAFGPRMTPALRARIVSNDAEALIAETFAERPSYVEALAKVTAPCLFFAGDADQPGHDVSKAASAGMARASFVSLPGLDHVEGGYRVDLVAPYVLAFLATVP